ncbi:MAG TPA: hypothetical protein VNP04_02620 [Alphaproteobacteria bacterium]|nr:hypothetical protein [Alphaproteobacteria bacterium]
MAAPDGDRRFLLGCPARSPTHVVEAKPVFIRRFNACGWPKRRRPAQEGPLATTPRGRRSPLSAGWLRLGSLPQLIAPGNPQQHGRPARRPRPRKAATTRPRRAQPRQCERWHHACNGERPHEALAMQTPAARSEGSPHVRPTPLPPLAYPDRFALRDVSANGGSRCNHRGVNVAHPCVGEAVGLAAIADGVWNVSFGPRQLGRLRERHLRLEEADGRRKRRR